MNHSKINHANQEHFNSTLFGDRSSDIRHSNTPIDLILSTVHPDDDQNYYISSIFAPGIAFNHTFSLADTRSYPLFATLHQHDYYELLYVIRGEMYQLIENERHLYAEGSLCLLNCNVRHTEEFSTDFRVAFLSIPKELIHQLLSDSNSFFFQSEQHLQDALQTFFFTKQEHPQHPALKEYIDFIPRTDSPGVNEKMYRLFQQILTLFLSQKVGATYQIMAVLLEIFFNLSDSSNYRTTPVKIGTDLEADIFNQITSLLKKNHGRLSRSDLEEKLNYNGAYLNKIVKKYTGQNIFHYGMSFCMKEAEDLLINSKKSISQISDMLHFTNRTHFYKIFKDIFGMTPKEYRKSVTGENPQ